VCGKGRWHFSFLLNLLLKNWQIITYMQYYIHRRKKIYLIGLWTYSLLIWLSFSQNFKNTKYPVSQKYNWWEWCCSIRSKTTKLIVIFSYDMNASKTNSVAEGNSWKVMWSKEFCHHGSWYRIGAVENNRMSRSLCHQLSKPTKCICFPLNIRIIRQL